MKWLFVLPTIFLLLFGTPALTAEIPTYEELYESQDERAIRLRKADEHAEHAAKLPAMLKKANQGDADAQNDLGRMYFYGNGVPYDYQTALKWYRLAAEQGLAEAQLNLGWMYRYDHVGYLDYKAALKWITLAAEQGNTTAQYNLGWFYYH